MNIHLRTKSSHALDSGGIGLGALWSWEITLLLGRREDGVVGPALEVVFGFLKNGSCLLLVCEWDIFGDDLERGVVDKVEDSAGVAGKHSSLLGVLNDCGELLSVGLLEFRAGYVDELNVIDRVGDLMLLIGLLEGLDAGEIAL